MKLITIENNTPILRAEIAAEIADFERQVKSIKKRQDELKKAILDEMEANGIIKVDTDKMTISYVAATDRETFDSKAFRNDHSDLYDEYVKMSPVKASVRIKVKE